MMIERSCRENVLLLHLMFLEQKPIWLRNVMNSKVLHFFIPISIKCIQQYFIRDRSGMGTVVVVGEVRRQGHDSALWGALEQRCV